MTLETLPFIAFDMAAYDPRRIQPVTHALSGHPLLALDALLALAKRLPPKQVRFHAITATADTDFAQAPELHPHALGIHDAMDNIATSGSWIALHNVQSDPEYKALLDQALDQVESRITARDPGMFNRAFWIFLQSPRSVTPFHMDHEQNFLMQIRGRKLARVWHPEDCLSDYALEVFHAQFTRKEAHYQESFNERAHTFHLEPGLGAYMPNTCPHLVHNLDEVSVTISMTYCTAATRRVETINRGNNFLRRRLGVKPLAVGRSPLRDEAKNAVFSSLFKGRALLKGQSLDVPDWARGTL